MAVSITLVIVLLAGIGLVYWNGHIIRALTSSSKEGSGGNISSRWLSFLGGAKKSELNASKSSGLKSKDSAKKSFRQTPVNSSNVTTEAGVTPKDTKGSAVSVTTKDTKDTKDLKVAKDTNTGKPSKDAPISGSKDSKTTSKDGKNSPAAPTASAGGTGSGTASTAANKDMKQALKDAKEQAKEQLKDAKKTALSNKTGATEEVSAQGEKKQKQFDTVGATTGTAGASAAANATTGPSALRSGLLKTALRSGDGIGGKSAPFNKNKAVSIKNMLELDEEEGSSSDNKQKKNKKLGNKAAAGAGGPGKAGRTRAN